jgi:hypothetical protein
MPKSSQKRDRVRLQTDGTAMNSYMAGCADLIAYIQQNGPLTEMNFQVLMRTVSTLELLLQAWKGKNGENACVTINQPSKFDSVD